MRSNRISLHLAPSSLTLSSTHVFFLLFISHSESTLSLQRCCHKSNQVLLIFNENPFKSYCQDKDFYFSNESFGTNHFNEDFGESNGTTNIPACQDPLLTVDNRLDQWFRENKDGSLDVGLNFWFWPAWLRVQNDSSACHEKNAIFISNRNESADVAETLITCGLQGLNAYLIHRGLYGALYIISFVFVLLILIIYGILWKEQNTHGVAQLSFFIGVAMFYLTEGTRILVKFNGLHIKPSTYCFVHAVIAQYFFIIVNTTSVVLGFDLLWTLWKLDATAYKAKIWKRIYVYSFLSWIVPLILIITALTLNHYISPDASKNEAGIFEYAHYRCSSPLWQSGFYLQSLLYLLNIILFILTSILICKHRQRRQIPNSRRAKRLLRETISIHSRLFFILGMTWTAVVIEFFVGQNNPLSFMWLVLRVVNLLLGILYFVLFGLSRKHIASLRTKFPAVNGTFIKLGYDADISELGDTNTQTGLADSATLKNLTSERPKTDRV